MKRFFITFIFCLFIFGSISVYGATLEDTISDLRSQGYNYIFGHFYDPERPNTPKNYYLYACMNTPIWNQQNDPLQYKITAEGEWMKVYTFIPWSSSSPNYGTNNEITYWDVYFWQPFTLYNGDINNDYPDFVELSEDFINTGEPEEEPTWYEEAWDIFKSWLGNTPWDDNNIVTMISDFWKKWTNGGNDPTDINIVGYSTPTPQPTPTPKPTPIQYSVSLIDINGGQEIIYNYVDPTSGLPTSSPYNPNIDITIQSGGSGTTITTPVPVILATGTPEFQNILFTSEDSTDLEINVGQIGEYVDVIENGLIENTDAMEEVSNIFSMLPNNWFMIIGIIACIPIIAAVISRFLH